MYANFINASGKDQNETQPCGRTIAEIAELCKTLPIKDLATRTIYFEPSSTAELPSNAVVVVGSYPNGFTARVIRAIYHERKSAKVNEYKCVYVTSDKHTSTRWNAPNKTDSTYTVGVPYFAKHEIDGVERIVAVVFNLESYYLVSRAKEDFTNGSTEKRDTITRFAESKANLMSEEQKAHIADYLKRFDDVTAKLTELRTQAAQTQTVAA